MPNKIALMIWAVLLLVQGRTGWTDYVTRPSWTYWVSPTRSDGLVGVRTDWVYRAGTGRTGSPGFTRLGRVGASNGSIQTSQRWLWTCSLAQQCQLKLRDCFQVV